MGEPTLDASLYRYVETQTWNVDSTPYLLIQLGYFGDTQQRMHRAHVTGFNAEELRFAG
jgi:hypothetical protein